MLFEIKLPADQIATFAAKERRDYLRAIENLLRARLERKHIVHMAPEDIGRIRELGSVSQDSADVLAWIQARFSEIEGLKRSLACYAALEPRATRRVDTVDGRRILMEDLGAFVDTSHVQRAVLLCENKKDSEFYAFLAQVLAHKLGLRSVVIKLDHRGGGGTEIANEYGEYVTGGAVVLAVADSDRLCADLPLRSGSPADLLTKIVPLKWVQHALHIRSRSIENVVSDELWWVALERGHARELKRKFEVYYQKLHDAEWRKYARLKEDGQLLCDIKELPPGSECGARWGRYATDLNSDFCRAQQPCSKKENCKCQVLVGFGEHAHRKVMVWLRRNFRSARESAPYFEWSLQIEREVAEYVLAWGCVDGRSVGSS